MEFENSESKTRGGQPPPPFVSVVVPVFNAPVLLKACLEQLARQTYPVDRFEVLVVDNGSRDRTPDVARCFDVQLLFETRFRSPYAARNLGLKHARGEVVAFLDASCVPTPGWLESGVGTLVAENADLVGGQVTFTFSSKPSVGEMLDAISNVNMKGSILERGVAKGGNLFVSRPVFEKIGEFPIRRSGVDVLWTARATKAGLRLVYSAEAEVFYAARPLIPLLKKQHRVGRGQPDILREAGMSLPALLLRTLIGFRPPSPASIRKRILERGRPEMLNRLGSLWACEWLARMATMVGRLDAIIRRL